MPDILRKDRRLQRRVDLIDPLRARTGSTPILITDLSTGGMRILHSTHIGRVGETVLLFIEQNGQTFQLNCEVRRTEMKVMEGDPPRNVFESGLRITVADDAALTAYTRLMETEAHKVVMRKPISIAVPP